MYKEYIMYIKGETMGNKHTGHTALYSAAGLRSNLREALNFVDRGTEVYVRRHGSNYRITPAEDLEYLPNDVEEDGAISVIGHNSDPNEVMNVEGEQGGLSPDDRTPESIINEISFAEARRDDAVEYCQDPDEAKRIKLKWDMDIQKLWGEYHSLKEA